LTPPHDGDVNNAPDLDPGTNALDEQYDRDEPEEPTDIDPPDGPVGASADAEADDTDPADDPDHESAPPPETDPAVTFADLKLNRAVLDALAHART
jgi:ATP-dependent RNA helicase DeaD